MLWLSGWLIRHRIRVFVHRIRFPGQAMFSDEAAAQFVGKRIIVGITRQDHTRRLIGREQFHGRIVRASAKEGIVIQTPSGEERRLPPDLRAMCGAKPGQYTLHASGEVVVNPDLQTLWTLTSPPIPGSTIANEPSDSTAG